MEDAAAATHNPNPKLKQKINQNPNNFLTNNFLYRTTLVIVFLILLPLFPFQAPQFINQTVSSRSWELIQFIFVGIALSYGLFSKKNDDDDAHDDHHEIEKQQVCCTSSKLDNAQTYVSKLLEVSSVFDDQNVIDDDHKVQAIWNSQHYREEPLVVTANENPVPNEDNGVVIQKPLLLPIRSLKQRVIGDESSSSSNTSSKRFISNLSLPRNGEVDAIDFKKQEEKMEENVVLRSPIPWRSRLGNLEIEGNWDTPPESSKLETRSFRPNPKSKKLSSSSPRKLLYSTSFSPETQSKSREDVVRTKSFSSSQPVPPPPPPPPPPPFLRKSMLMKSNSSTTNNSDSSEKEFRRSISDVSLSGNNVRRFISSEPIIVEEKKGYSNSNNMINERKPNILEEKVLTENTDSEGESEEYDYFEEGRGIGEEVEIDNSLNDLGPDVDKKADEFIAKFREQIRLQRIESIRKSTLLRSAKNLR